MGWDMGVGRGTEMANQINLAKRNNVGLLNAISNIRGEEQRRQISATNTGWSSKMMGEFTWKLLHHASNNIHKFLSHTN